METIKKIVEAYVWGNLILTLGGYAVGKAVKAYKRAKES